MNFWLLYSISSKEDIKGPFTMCYLSPAYRCTPIAIANQDAEAGNQPRNLGRLQSSEDKFSSTVLLDLIHGTRGKKEALYGFFWLEDTLETNFLKSNTSVTTYPTEPFIHFLQPPQFPHLQNVGRLQHF